MGDAYRFRRCLVGGTFDRFHAGHRLLLDAAQRAGQAVEIHITSDLMAEHKSIDMQSFETRREAVLDWVERHAPRRVTVHELIDAHGPAPTHTTADCIVATPETRGQCERINEQREQHGLPPLHIIEVAHLSDHTGHILSSSRIRNGQTDTEGHPWVHPSWKDATLHLHARAEPELKSPMGTLYEGPEDQPDVAMYAALDDLDLDSVMLIAVGDVTVATLLDMGYIPDMAFIDGQTKRTPLAEDNQVNISSFAHRLHAVNPAGQLTPSMYDTIVEAASYDQPVVVEVEGEEDLAPLYIHLLVPLHAVVVYGQPHRGVVVQPSSLATKERCRRLLEMFEVD